MILNTTGNIGVCILNPANLLDVNGIAHATTLQQKGVGVSTLISNSLNHILQLLLSLLSYQSMIP
jgi:hypothetical protein